MLEVILEGKYYWIPFCRIARIEIEKPSDLRDLVWMPARFTWTNGGTVSGPHPGALSRHRESRRTTPCGWPARPTGRKPAPRCYLGSGQRVLATDAGEYPLLECRID